MTDTPAPVSNRVRLVRPWRMWVRRHRFWLNIALAAVNAFLLTYTLRTGWPYGVPLCLLGLAALVLLVREIREVNRLELRRIESAARGVRPRRGIWHRHDRGEDCVEVRFVETGEPGVFLAVTLDGDPVAVAPGDGVDVDMVGPGQSVTWTLDPGGREPA